MSIFHEFRMTTTIIIMGKKSLNKKKTIKTKTEKKLISKKFDIENIKQTKQTDQMMEISFFAFCFAWV